MKPHPVFFHGDELRHYASGDVEAQCNVQGHETAFCGKHDEVCQGPSGGEINECVICVMVAHGMGGLGQLEKDRRAEPQRVLVPA